MVTNSGYGCGRNRTYDLSLTAPDFALTSLGVLGIEPRTSSLSVTRSATELHAQKNGEVKAGGSGLRSTTELRTQNFTMGSERRSAAELRAPLENLPYCMHLAKSAAGLDTAPAFCPVANFLTGRTRKLPYGYKTAAAFSSPGL